MPRSPPVASDAELDYSSGVLRACLTLFSAVAVIGGAIAACSTNTTLTTVTGVLIRADALVAGHGCGRGDRQVYKYVAVAFYDPEAGAAQNARFAATFDCFTDGVFANLSASPVDGNLNFDIAIFAFNQATYDANAGAIATAVSDANDRSRDPTLALMPLATFTTSCKATQQANIQVLAVCGHLMANRNVGDGGADGASDAGDAGDASPASDGGDAGIDAAQASLTIATDSLATLDGGTVRCGPDYDTVTGVWHDNRDAGPASQGFVAPVSCPSPLVVPALAGVGYEVDVIPTVKADGGPRAVAKLTCNGTAVAGQAVTPICAPAPL